MKVNLQEIEFNSASVKNQHVFGTSLQAFCRNDSNIDLLPGHGFMDGGCLALAVSLKQWIDVSLMFTNKPVSKFFGVGSDKCSLEHVVLGVPVQYYGDGDLLVDDLVFLDCDGVSSEADLLAKMQGLEGLQSPYVYEIIPDNCSDTVAYIEANFDIYSYAESFVPIELTTRLAKRFGDFESERFVGHLQFLIDDLEQSQSSSPCL